MSLTNVHIGPFAAVYVGLANDTDVLTELTGLTTDAHRVAVDIPETFNYSVLNSLQSGPLTIQVNLTFLSDDPQGWRLAYGNFLDAAFQDSASQFELLTVLLVHPDQSAESSFLIPQCYARKTINTNWAKNAPTVLPLQLGWQDLNRFNNVYYKRTPDYLATILGPRSPI